MKLVLMCVFNPNEIMTYDWFRKALILGKKLLTLHFTEIERLLSFSFPFAIESI